MTKTLSQPRHAQADGRSQQVRMVAAASVAALPAAAAGSCDISIGQLGIAERAADLVIYLQAPLQQHICLAGEGRATRCLLDGPSEHCCAGHRMRSC